MSVAVAIHKWWQYKLQWQYTNATNMAPMVTIQVAMAIHQGDHSLCISFSHVTIAKYCDDTTNTINATTTNIPRRSLTASHYTRYYPRTQRHCLPLTWILFLCSCICICDANKMLYEFVFATLHVFAFAMLYTNTFAHIPQCILLENF